MPFDQDQPAEAQTDKRKRPGTRDDSGPHPVDMHVGLRLRQRRTLLGMSQERLGDALGLTFQQVQKYERGANRIGASRLFHLSRLLDVSVNYFFDDMPADVSAAVDGNEPSAEQSPGFAEEAQARLDTDPMARKETLDLVRAYYSIGDTGVRRRILDLARTLAKTE